MYTAKNICTFHRIFHCDEAAADIFGKTTMNVVVCSFWMQANVVCWPVVASESFKKVNFSILWKLFRHAAENQWIYVILFLAPWNHCFFVALERIGLSIELIFVCCWWLIFIFNSNVVRCSWRYHQKLELYITKLKFF